MVYGWNGARPQSPRVLYSAGKVAPISGSLATKDRPSYSGLSVILIDHWELVPGRPVKWEGGENPVPGKVVRIKLGSGRLAEGPSDDWTWDGSLHREANIAEFMIIPEGWGIT